MKFKDYFSQNASNYAKYRPGDYPESLFAFLNTITEEHKTAWDCATGNGQVAHKLVSYFDKVYASDASKEQINNAVKHNKIEYFVSLAESSSLESHSIDLITVAQAFHWFNADAFYAEAKRVLKPKGIIAIWCYGLLVIPNASDSLNAALQEFYQVLEPFWSPEIKTIDNKYRDISFPFREIDRGNRNFSMTQNWTVDRLIGYLKTWSSTQKLIANRGISDLTTLITAISQNWSPEQNMTIHWPLHLRVGKI